MSFTAKEAHKLSKEHEAAEQERWNAYALGYVKKACESGRFNARPTGIPDHYVDGTIEYLSDMGFTVKSRRHDAHTSTLFISWDL